MMPLPPVSVLHARCGCRPCLRSQLTLCGLPSPKPARRAVQWCVVCTDLLAFDRCPRVQA